MRAILRLLLAMGALGTLGACTTVENSEPSVHSSTTTTEETTIHRPVSSTSSETRTIRAY